MAKTKTFYPLIIKPDYTTRQSPVANSTGCKGMHQAMKGANNLKSNNSNIAYWGDRFPDKTHSQKPERYYPNTITSFSGTWNTPSPFNVTAWNIPDDIDNNAIVKEVTLEYAISHVQYVNQHVQNAGWAYNSDGCKFYASEVKATGAGDVRAESGGKAKNCATNYLIAFDFGGINTFSGQGLQYKDRTTKNLDTYTSLPKYTQRLYSKSNSKLTIGQLKKAPLRFILPRNLNWDIGRIVMQYVRIIVKYENIEPQFKIKSLTYAKKSLNKSEKDKITLEIETTNGYTDDIDVQIKGNGISTANITNRSDTNFKNQVWTAKKFNNKGIAKLTFDVSYNSIGTKTIQATVQNSSKTISLNVNSNKSIFNAVLLEDNITYDDNQNAIHAPSNKSFSTNDTIEVYDIDNKTGFLEVTLKKDITNKETERLIITSEDLPLELTDDSDEISYINDQWQTNNITKANTTIRFFCQFNISGTYVIKAQYINKTYPSYNQTKTYHIIVKGVPLKKDVFKMRLEDGSDVKYNSLMFTQGDDLKIPLTYTIEQDNTYMNNMIITGEQKRLPINEIHYINFNIELNNKYYYCPDCNTSGLGNHKTCPQCQNSNIENHIIQNDNLEIKNVLTYIEAFSDDIRCDDIIIGSSSNAKLITNDDNEKICVIDSISIDHPTTIKLAIQSFDEKECNIYIKPYNESEPYNYLPNNPHKWIPAHVLFKNIPNIKIWIEGIDDIDTSINDTFSLYYHIQNLSDIQGENLRFQIKEPSYFKKLNAELYYGNNLIDKDSNYNVPYFNKNNRILTFPLLEPQSVQNDYRLRIDYKATKKGIYDFIIKTLDNQLDLNDDQYSNYYKHQLLVDIPSKIKIQTTVDKKNPYVNDFVDLHINVTNQLKKQSQFVFEIYDIGQYDNNHSENHYQVQPDIICSQGTFTPSTENNNLIGTWTINNIDKNTNNDLIITLQALQPGTHIIQTIFKNNNQNITSQTFTNKITVLDRKKQIDFNVYHAINEDLEQECPNCNDLIPICDTDFINLKDYIYYVFEVTNNNRNDINDDIYIYARLPQSFLKNGIICHSPNITYDIHTETNLIKFHIPNLKGCKSAESKKQFCIKILPNEVGNFISNFSLSTKSAQVLTKQLKLTVDTEFNERKLEHEINIYNFEKTNKYYRYEIDDMGEIFKFFNKGDKSVRLIDHHKYNKSSIETYKGTNLRRLVKEMKKSKYIDPLFLREGTNQMHDKGYELYPDGLMRRFGLLRSEVFHYSNQLPITSNLVERAMKWDIDSWDTKVWGGDIYDNGVFDLTIDYAKVPSNFNILDVDYPIKNLQTIVDNARPYGTKALCYYSAVINLTLKMFISDVKNIQNYYQNLKLKFLNDKIGMISEYNNNNSKLFINYDTVKMNLKTNIDNILTDINYRNKAMKNNNMYMTPNIKSIDTVVYAKQTSKNNIQDCLDIVENIYNTTTQSNNIDILKKYNDNDFITNNLPSTNVTQQIINFNNINDITGLQININNTDTTHIYNTKIDIKSNTINFIFENDKLNYFNGFKIIINDDVIESYNIEEYNIGFVSMQIQTCYTEEHNILHFWGSVNNENYHHIGYVILPNSITFTFDKISDNTVESYYCNIDNPITFKLSDKINKIIKKFDSIKSMERKNRWKQLQNVNHKNKYAYFANDINIDSVCNQNDYKVNVPKLILKYNNINLNESDEIIDIAFKIKAQTNKKNFTDDINVNIYRDGDMYMPYKNIAKNIYYANNIYNKSQELLATMQIEQPNITICADCMKTDLGYYEYCQHCHSENISHSNEKIPATICHNCQYIANGHHKYCIHCLSYDVDTIKIDYNKTYCNECHKIADDYYTHCPYCFSTDIVHLTNDKKTYEIFGPDTQNIDPINIQVVEKRVNIFNLDIPFSYKTKEISKKSLQYLNLTIHGNNHNHGLYHYCESCGIGGLGHYHKCPNCGSDTIHNEKINNYVMDIYCQMNNKIQHFAIEPIHDDFATTIELQDISLENKNDSFQLLFYIDNQMYDNIANEIMALPIRDEYQGDLISALMKMDITINNLSLDYKYNKQTEWKNIDNFYGKYHTGITYNIPYNHSTTNNIIFNNFDVAYEKYNNAILHLYSIIKNTNSYKIHFHILNNNKTYDYITEIMTSDICDYNLDLIPIVGSKIKNLKISISFFDCEPKTEITILSLDLLTNYNKTKDTIHNDINELSTNVIQKEDYYLLLSKNNNIWGLNNKKPYYLSGRQLLTNLISYIDFGHLNLNEYIRLYNIEMIVLYKNKKGQIITDNISLQEENNLDQLPNGAIINDDKYYLEQNINGKVKKVNGETWLTLKYPLEILNNLEYDIDTDNSDNIINAIPLRNKIAQSFILEATEINNIVLQYYKNRGYPNNIITVYLCKDNNNAPGIVIYKTKVHVDFASNIIEINFNINNLTYNDKYWLVIEDTNANSNNYHQFAYNKNIFNKQLIRYEDNNEIYDTNYSLSFSINTNINILNTYNLPINWSVNNDTEESEYDSYRMYMNLYRYNIQSYSNISVSDLKINHGYKITEVDNENT